MLPNILRCEGHPTTRNDSGSRLLVQGSEGVAQSKAKSIRLLKSEKKWP